MYYVTGDKKPLQFTKQANIAELTRKSIVRDLRALPSAYSRVPIFKVDLHQRLTCPGSYFPLVFGSWKRPTSESLEKFAFS